MPTILLVDDAATDRRLIGGLLERNGFAVRYAENGRGALKQLSRSLPDAVLTDMQMPEMDGLELVKAVRSSHPAVPVILMTGHGSETLAAQALQHGAASYVPKSQIQKLLIDSVRHVLELARGDANYQRLIDHTQISDFHFQLANDPELVEPLISLVQQMVGGMSVCDAAGCLQVGVALEQAVLNAMFHGNLELSSAEMRADREQRANAAADGTADSTAESPPESLVEQRLKAEPYCQRSVFVRALVSREEARLVVRDEGHGFDVQSSLDISLSDDENAGRGLVLMWALMDKVIYNKTGNEVTLIKRRVKPATAKPTSDSVAEQGTSAAVDTIANNYETLEEQKLGELVPLDGGKSIRLTQPRLIVGRDNTCDIVLAHSDVSHEHCLLYMYSGWWYVKDLKSANGTRVNKALVDQKRIPPGAILTIATHQYEARYSPWDLGAEGITPPVDPF
ncbi:MAG: response regulator [Planctomycetales bacterium]|nr:response regulator [Planctomycetales bacterium]